MRKSVAALEESCQSPEGQEYHGSRASLSSTTKLKTKVTHVVSWVSSISQSLIEFSHNVDKYLTHDQRQIVATAPQ